MNKFAINVVIALSMAGVAYANNDPTHYSSSSNWTGFYAGMNAGFVFNNLKLRSQQIAFTNPSEQCNSNSDFSTPFTGIQLGYMYQSPNSLVSGIEANIAFNTEENNKLGCSCLINPNVSDRFSFRNQRQAAIKGRLGHVLNWYKTPLLPYVTAGASFAHVGLSYANESGDYYSKNTTQAGPLIGAGIEWAFTQNWSLRAEYNYVNYGKIITLRIPNLYGLEDPNGNARINLNSNNIVVAINYWI